MYQIDENEMVQCPYDRSHVMKKLRIQKHLVKCQKQHPHVKLAACLYNYTHRFHPENMLEHYETCPNKTRIEEARYFDRPPDLVENKCKLFSDYNGEKSSSFNAENSDMNLSYKFCKNQLHNTSTAPETSQYYKKEINFFNENSLSSSEDELEPLPLPKTVSKAFYGLNSSKKKILPSPDKSIKLESHEYLLENETVSKNCDSEVVPDSKFTSESSLFGESTENSNETNILKSLDNLSLSDNEQIILKGFKNFVNLNN